MEEARAKLGQLVDDVATGGDHIALTKRGRPVAMIVGRNECSELEMLASEQARKRPGEQSGDHRDSFARALGPGSGVGILACGAGSAFEGSVTYAADLPQPIAEIGI